MGKNLAIIIPSLNTGGAERVASNITCYLPENINKYIYLFNKSEIVYPYKGQIVNLEIEKPNSDLFLYNPLSKINRLYWGVRKVKENKKTNKINCTISLLEPPNLLNILSARNNEKVILSVRNNKSQQTKGFYGFIYKNLIRLLYNKADKIVALSYGVKNDLINNFDLNEQKIEVIYPFVNKNLIDKLADEKIEDKYKDMFKGPVVINIGRLHKQKGQWHLIRAFKRVKENIPNAKLGILGEGNLKEYLKKLTEGLGLIDDVIFLGFQNNPYGFLSRATLFAFSSLYEGFGNSIIEAMTCGLPIVSTDCKYGPREIIAPGTNYSQIKNIEFGKYGVLVPVCDGKMHGANEPLTKEEEILSEGMIKIISNSKLEKYYRDVATERTKDFTESDIMRQWIELID